MVDVGPPGDHSPSARLCTNGLVSAVGDPGWALAARLAMSLTGATTGLVTAHLDGTVVIIGAAGEEFEPGAALAMGDVPCRWVITSGTPLAVADLRTDPRTRDDALVQRITASAYLGVPLRTSAGVTVGSVCVLDNQVREWDPAAADLLLDLARLLGLRLELQEERQQRNDLARLHADVVGGSLSGLVVMDDVGVILDVNPAVTTMLGWQREDLLGRTVAETLVPHGSRAAHDAGVLRVRGGGPHVAVGSRMEVLALAKDGELVPIELIITRTDSVVGTRYNGSLRDLRSQVRLQAGIRSVLSNSTVALLEVDLEGTVLRTEGHGLLGGADLVGAALDDVLGRAVSEHLLVPADGEPVRFDLEALGRAWRASAIPLRPGAGPATGWVVSLVDITDVRSAQAELEQAYRNDPLTGLLSRVGLELGVAAMVAASPGRTLRVTTLRLHGLGETNESFGHEVGDELLRVSASRLRRLLPPAGNEVMARVDAGQFSLVGYADSGVSTGWAEAAALQLIRPIRVRAVSVVPKVSVGTATCDIVELADQLGPTTGAPVVGELLRRAEVAVHAARRAGRTVREYHRSDDVAARRLVLASNLREALSTPPDGRYALDLGGRLRLEYQPVVGLPGTVVSVEALLRWEDDILGPLSPIEVVDVAEGAGLAVPLGTHVMALALHDAATWWADGHTVPVMVNLSALQVCETSLVDTVTELLERNGLPGAALIAEVTETATLQSAALAASVLGAVRRLGAAVYLDDFGSGWSTLERMGQLPLDGIKLDRSFVARCDTPWGLAAIHSAVALTRSLQIPLVVEGVETVHQAAIVTAAGADRAQGYLYSRPVRLERLRADVLVPRRRPSGDPARPGAGRHPGVPPQGCH